MSEAVNVATEVGTTFDQFLPYFAVLNGLAKNSAGNIYRQVAGTTEKIATWAPEHPMVVDAAETIASVVPGLSAVVPITNIALHILGEIGNLMATDPTITGPQPPASVPTPAAAA